MSLHARHEDFLFAEYSALRDEIGRRTDIQHQLFSFALAATGVMLTAGSSTALLAYPILAMFLAAAWAHSHRRIVRLGAYIRDSIEATFLGEDLGWEHQFPRQRQARARGRDRLAHVASHGIFVGTQVVAVLVGLLKTDSGVLDIVLLAADLLAIAVTVVLL